MLRCRSALLFLTSLTAALALGAGAHAAETKLSSNLDYGDHKLWVCRPGGCRDDLSATVLRPDGSTQLERFEPAVNPAVDCFYVYPTVSHGSGLAADPVVTADERRAVVQQVERFTSTCRLFVPVYRQSTVTGMLGRADHPKTREEALQIAHQAQGDVLAAWDYYMAHDNHGRGVILIGHSQGAGVLTEVIRRRIDGLATQRQLVSALLPGNAVFIPVGREVGGTFKSIPPCRSEMQIGCVISFNMVRSDRLIPPDTIFKLRGMVQVCTNPAALAGGSGWLKPYLAADGQTIIPDLTAPQPPWAAPAPKLATPFVTTPGLYRAECGGGGAYLTVTTVLSPEDRRTGAMTGDWVRDGTPDPSMGLHLIDLNLAAGDLAGILHHQAQVYSASPAATLIAHAPPKE